MSGCTFERNGRVLTGDRLPFYRMGREEVKPGDIMLMIVTHTWLYDVHCMCSDSIYSERVGVVHYSEFATTTTHKSVASARIACTHAPRGKSCCINKYSALN